MILYLPQFIILCRYRYLRCCTCTTAYSIVCNILCSALSVQQFTV